MTPGALLVGRAVLTVALVVAVWGFAVRRLPERWASIGWGALAFPLSQVARFAVLIPLSLALQPVLGGRFGPVNTALLVVTSGLFEETARWVVLRFWARRTRAWEGGVAFGLGHGGIEAILILVSAAVNGVVLLMTAGAVRGAVAAQSPQQLSAFDQQVESLRHLTVGLTAAGMYERASAVVTHVALTLLVLRAVRTGRWTWWALAVVVHCTLNAVAVGLVAATDSDVLVTEGGLTLVAVVLLWAVLRGPLSRRRWTERVEGSPTLR